MDLNVQERTGKATGKLKQHYKDLRDAVPYELQRKSTEDELDTERTLLITVHGKDTEVHRVNMDLDDMSLYNDEIECAITSNPIHIRGWRCFFTRGQYQGTMALNEDTLLGTDAYKVGSRSNDMIAEVINDKNPNKDVKPSEVSEMDEEQIKELVGDEYGWMGDIIELTGSKNTLRTHNKAKVERKLLSASVGSKKKKLLFIAAGAVIGYMMRAQGLGV